MELYLTPKNRFVAGFIGSPKMNFIGGAEAQKYGAHSLGVRPEHFIISQEKGEWKATVGVLERLGSETFIHLVVEGIEPLTARAEGHCSLKYGDTVYLSADRQKMHFFAEDGSTFAQADWESIN